MNAYYKEKINRLPVRFIDTIDSIMAIITTINEVEKVIMFGSCSRGQQTENSDIDLLLLVNSKKSEMPFYRLEQKIGGEIYEHFCFNGKKDVELLIADKDVYNNSTDPMSVYRRVKKDGVVLYEQLL